MSDRNNDDYYPYNYDYYPVQTAIRGENVTVNRKVPVAAIQAFLDCLISPQNR